MSHYLNNQVYISVICPLSGTHQLIYDTEQGTYPINFNDDNWFPYNSLWYSIIDEEEPYQNTLRS